MEVSPNTLKHSNEKRLKSTLLTCEMPSDVMRGSLTWKLGVE